MKTISKHCQSQRSCETTPTFIDIFAGCGGLSLGLLQSGWDGLFAIEQDSNAFETLRANLLSPASPYRFSWPCWLPQSPMNVAYVLDQYRSRLDEIAGNVDLLVGGPPCQGFSCAGRRNPNDPRNQLVKTYLDFVGILRPRMVLIENVRGMTADFEDAGAPGQKINYASRLQRALSNDYVVSSKMIDVSTFGVPQRRQRFIVIGVRQDVKEILPGCPFALIEGRRQAFLRAKGISAIPVTSRMAISDLEVSKNGKIPSSDTDGFEEIAYRAPTTSYQRLMNRGRTKPITDTRLARHKREITNRFKKLIKLCHADGRLNVSISKEIRASLGLRKCAIRVLDPDNASPTITSMPDDLIHYSEPRILTVRENARLQGFPDWFSFKGKYTTGGHRRRREIPRFTQVANAVPPLVAEAIGETLAHCIRHLQGTTPTTYRQARRTSLGVQENPIEAASSVRWLIPVLPY